MLSCRELSLIQVCSLHQATGKFCPCFTVHPLSDPSACSSESSELRLLFSCGGGGCSQPALQKGVGAKRQGSSPGLTQHPPLLGSAWWSLRVILADCSACHIFWDTRSSSVPGMPWVPALFLVFLAPGKCVAWMLWGFFCTFWQW